MKRASTIAAALVLAWAAAAGAQEESAAEEATEAVEEEAAGSPTFVGGVTLTTEYVLRGISQTNEDPAVQGNIDFLAGGFYVGVWGSNVEVSAIGLGIETHAEFDLYAGYLWQGESGFGWELGAIHYEYPKHEEINYEEYYASLLYKTFKVKYSYADDFLGFGGEGHYVDGKLDIPLGKGFNLGLHAGYSTFADIVGLREYFDFRGGLGYTHGTFTVEVAYTDTNEDQFQELEEGRVIGSVSLKM